MSLGLHHQRAQSRRRRRWLLFKWFLALAVIAAMGVFSYRTGSELARREVSRLEEEVETLTSADTELRAQNAQLEVEVNAARQRAAQWRERYEKEVPTGKSRELFMLMREQMDKGADADRIAFMIGEAAKKQSCDASPVTKRFLVRTPLYVGANDSVSFADNAITVTAEGESATNAEGKPEAWYDTAKPVTLKFIELGGTTTEAKGMLPLFHSVVRGGNEYRFSATAADSNGFIIVTSQRCVFP
jgi:outer membrane murein-binding lipoprotein Lpp